MILKIRNGHRPPSAVILLRPLQHLPKAVKASVDALTASLRLAFAPESVIWLAPFGYMNTDDHEEPIKPHPERARTVVCIFDLYARGNMTFKSLADKLQREGHVLRRSQPRFNRTALSYILNNRFYVGELIRHGKAYPGKHRLLSDRRTFQACQDILKGRNRRTGKPEHPYAGGLFRCEHCGAANGADRFGKAPLPEGRQVLVLGPEEDERIALRRDQWYCLEHMIQVNDIGKANGELAAWIDGKLYIHYTGIRWRTSAAVKLKRFDIGVYVHQARQDNTVWYDEVALSTGYIGPKGVPETQPPAQAGEQAGGPG